MTDTLNQETKYIDGYNLKACPRCHSFEHLLFDVENDQATRVVCAECDGKWFASCQTAADAWNQRPIQYVGKTDEPKQGEISDEIDDKCITRDFEEWATMPYTLPIAKDGDGVYESEKTAKFFNCFDYAYRKGMWGAARKINAEMSEQLAEYQKLDYQGELPLKREYRPHPDTKMSIRIKNAIHRLNLDRSDIASLPDGATISRNISDDRYMAALLTDILTEIEGGSL